MAWQLLIGSDIGLLSLGTIIGVLVIGAYMVSFYARKGEEDAKNAAK